MLGKRIMIIGSCGSGKSTFNKIVYTYRIIKRADSFREKMRSDMAQECLEIIDMNFLLYVWNFYRTMRPRIYAC